jgi:hypothetical protein
MNDGYIGRVWDEYKYRHQHCWNTIFKLTFATITMSALPYTQLTIACVIGGWILLLPLVAIGLTLFGSIVLYRELRLLSEIRSRYRALEKTADLVGKDWFTFLAMLYLALLLACTGLNLCAVRIWMAAITAASSPGTCFQLVPPKTTQGKAPDQ